MNAASGLLIEYWWLVLLAGVLVILLLLPIRRAIRRANGPVPAAASPPPPPPPPPTAVQRLAASIEQAAREKAQAARVSASYLPVPPSPRQSAWTARPEPEPTPREREPELPVLPSAPLEPVAQPALRTGHTAFGRPAGIGEPRPGGRDDLKQISGIGPRIERGLNELGVFHYDQIAAWDKRTVIWVENQFSLRGRISRERWVHQAKELTTAERPRRSVRG